MKHLLWSVCLGGAGGYGISTNLIYCSIFLLLQIYLHKGIVTYSKQNSRIISKEHRKICGMLYIRNPFILYYNYKFGQLKINFDGQLPILYT